MSENFEQAATRIQEFKESRDPLAIAHEHCTHNRAEIERSEKVGCFYCCQIYDSSLIEEWIDGTAVCAKCPVDSVIGDASGFPVTDQAFLKSMYEVWFSSAHNL